jgi:hypothetical protein
VGHTCPAGHERVKVAVLFILPNSDYVDFLNCFVTTSKSSLSWLPCDSTQPLHSEHFKFIVRIRAVITPCIKYAVLKLSRSHCLLGCDAVHTNTYVTMFRTNLLLGMHLQGKAVNPLVHKDDNNSRSLFCHPMPFCPTARRNVP